MPDPGAPESPPKPFATLRPAGDYEVKGELGRGGMGVVYRARQITLNRIVALKILTGRSGPDGLARFLAEAETAAGLHHANIIQIYEVGDLDSVPFFSMEYVESGSLADRLRNGPIEEREAAQLLISVARALHFGHRNGVVHRDGDFEWTFPIPGDSLAKGEHTLEVRLINAEKEEGSDQITFDGDLSGRYNPYPMVEPVVRQRKFC